MNNRNIALLVVAVVVAALFAFLVRGWLTSRPGNDQEKKANKMVEVMIAAKDLPMGKLIKQGDLVWQKWPETSVRPEQLRKSAGQKLEDQINNVVRVGMRAGEPITSNRLVEPGTKGYMAAILTPGMRAITISMSATSGVGGYVFPGDRVDVLLTRNVKGRTVSETVLQNVRILGTGLSTADINANPKDPKRAMRPRVQRNMTVELTPKLVEKVQILQRLGRLSFALRPLGMPEGEATLASGVDDLMPEDKTPTHTWDSETSPLQPPLIRKVSGQVTVVRGTRVQTVNFKNDAQAGDEQ